MRNTTKIQTHKQAKDMLNNTRTRAAKKARKTSKQLEKVGGGGTQGNEDIMEGSREDGPTLNQLEEVHELPVLPKVQKVDPFEEESFGHKIVRRSVLWLRYC